MKKTPFVLILAVAFASLWTSAAPTVAKTPALSSAGVAALNARLDAASKSGDVPAAAVLVTNAESVMYERAARKQNVAANIPLREDSIFRIASMTKAITSAA